MAAAAATLLIARPLLSWWVGSAVSPPFILLLGLALWTVTECCGITLSMFLNGAGIMRFQIIVASTFGICCVALKIFLTSRYGIAAVPWATLLTYLPISMLSSAIYVPRALRHLTRAANPVTVATPVIEG
jgi:hypothetical protein